jgi:hypothetical protein
MEEEDDDDDNDDDCDDFTMKSFKVLISNTFFFVGQLRAPVNLVCRSRKRILLVVLGVIAIETFYSR